MKIIRYVILTAITLSLQIHNVTKQGNALADDKTTPLRYRIILPDHV